MGINAPSSLCLQSSQHMLQSVYTREETRLVKGLCELSYENLRNSLPSLYNESELNSIAEFVHHHGISLGRYVYANLVLSYPGTPDAKLMASEWSLGKYKEYTRRYHIYNTFALEERDMLRALRVKFSEDILFMQGVSGYSNHLVSYRDILSPYFLLEHAIYRGMFLAGELMRPDRMAVKAAIDRVGVNGMLYIRKMLGEVVRAHGCEDRVW